MDRTIHTAVGVRDIYGSELTEKLTMMDGIREVFKEAGYDPIETPAFEYMDVFGEQIGTTPVRDLYKFFDREGNILALRPDFTPSVARAVAMYFEDVPRPIRLRYEGRTFINSSEYRGLMKETTQMGIECIGRGDSASDTEVILLTIRALLAAGLNEFQVSIGEVEFFRSMVEKTGLSREETDSIRRLITRKNFFALEERVEELDLSEADKEAFVKLPQLYGDSSVIRKAEPYAIGEAAKCAIARLAEIDEAVRKAGYGQYISFDFGMLSKYHYYTGIIFAAYTYGTGEPVVKGGRYDRLLPHFGAEDPAVGFAVNIDQLCTAKMRGHKDA